MYISQLLIFVLGVICSLFALFWYFWMLVKSFCLSYTCFSRSFVQIYCFPSYDLLSTRYLFFFFPKGKCLSVLFPIPFLFSICLFHFFLPQARVNVSNSPSVFPSPLPHFSFFSSCSFCCPCCFCFLSFFNLSFCPTFAVCHVLYPLCCSCSFFT